ncbi:MAG TPA: hypothetical protein VFT92_04010 [Nitrospira sp.]|nr:hypothetical protein [Nitrospira sp.]
MNIDWWRASLVVVLTSITAAPVLPIVHAEPPQHQPAISGQDVEPADCSASRDEDRRCALRGPGSHNRPVEPVMPPVTPPTEPPEDGAFPPFLFGWMKASLHITGGERDVTYVSNKVTVEFRQRQTQDMPGNTQYILVPDHPPAASSVTWTGTGREGDCSVEGGATIVFPAGEPTVGPPGLTTPLDPTRPAYGYLNVVGPDGGDFTA